MLTPGMTRFGTTDIRRHSHRRPSLVLLFLVVAAPLATRGQASGEQVPTRQSTITDHVRFLAGDSVGGRAVGSAGIEKAARYIADAFKACGLQPGGPDGSFFQAFKADVPLLKRSLPTRNILGVIPGSGPLADQYVVIGAHYDASAVGVSTPIEVALRRPGNDRGVSRGADDNASGVAAMIEVGKRLAEGAANAGSRRSVLLVALTGEEVRAAGSKYFVEHPTVPLDKITAMVNIDTVGRMKDRRVDAYGVMSGQEFRDLLIDVGRELHLKVIDPPRRERHSATATAPITATAPVDSSAALTVVMHKALGVAYYTPFYGGCQSPVVFPSDDVPFFIKQIPVIFFSTGKPGHLPDDTVDHLNIDGITRVAEIVHHLTDKLIHAPSRVTFEHYIPGEP